MQKWYVQFSEQLVGPLTEKEIQKNVKLGHIPSESFLSMEGDSEWYPAMQLDFVRPYFSGEQISLEVDLLPERHWVVLVANSFDEDFDQDGPFATREILSKIARGELEYTDRIWRPGFQTWLQIGEVANFLPSKLKEDDKVEEEPKPILSGGEREELLQSVAQFEGRDILEYAEELPPVEAMGEDLTKPEAKKRFSIKPTVDEINQLSFDFQKKAKAVSAELKESSIQSWLPKMKAMKKRSWKLPLGRVAAVLSLLLTLGLLLNNFVSIEPSTEAQAEEEAYQDLTSKRLRIYGNALQSLRPRLEIRSNYENEDQLHVEVIGLEGRILKNYRFHRSKSLAFLPGETLEVSLADENLGDGFYQVKARLGNLTAEKEIFVGVKDVQFETRLKQFNSQKRKRADLEKKIIEQVSADLVDRSKEIKEVLTKNKLTEVELKTFHNSWKRKFYETAHTELKTFGPETSGDYVYPEDFRKLKTLRIDLWKTTKDLSVKNRQATAKSVVDINKKLQSL